MCGSYSIAYDLPIKQDITLSPRGPQRSSRSERGRAFKDARAKRGSEGQGTRYTRDRRRPELREYLTGLRFGSILVRPVPLFTSMI